MITNDFLSWNDAFSAHLSQTYNSQKTIQTAQQHIRVFVAWWKAEHDAQFNPASITNVSIRAFRQHSLDVARVRANTWNARRWSLSLLTDWIEKNYGPKYTGLMAGIDIKRQGICPPRYRALDNKEFRALEDRLEYNVRNAKNTFFANITAVRNRAIVTILVHAGLRVEELSELDFADINIKDRSGSVRVRDGKREKERFVPLNKYARLALTEWVNVCGNSTATALFTGKQTMRISTRQVENIVSDIGKQIGIPDMSPHWLRYTFGKRLEHAGVNIQTISEFYGHESMSTTQHYLRSSQPDLQSMVEMI